MTMKRPSPKLTSLSLFLAFIASSAMSTNADDIDFETQIKPLLVSKCFDCHAADTQESHLRLDRRAAMLRGGDSGEPAMVVGDSEGSHLIKLVSGRARDCSAAAHVIAVIFALKYVF